MPCGSGSVEGFGLGRVDRGGCDVEATSEVAMSAPGETKDGCSTADATEGADLHVQR
jgi:hypothetical protein